MRTQRRRGKMELSIEALYDLKKQLDEKLPMKVDNSNLKLIKTYIKKCKERKEMILWGEYKTGITGILAISKIEE